MNKIAPREYTDTCSICGVSSYLKNMQKYCVNCEGVTQQRIEYAEQIECRIKELREALSAIENWSDWALWKERTKRDRMAMLTDIHAKAESALAKTKEDK